MNLAADVRVSLDLSTPVGAAKGTLLAHLDTDAVLNALVSGDAATLATGDLGIALADLGSGLLASPETLLGPLEEALSQLAGELDLGPLGKLGDLLDTLEVVGRVAERVIALTAPGVAPFDLGSASAGGGFGLTGSPLPSIIGGSFGDVVNLVLDNVDLPNRLAPVGKLRAAVDAVDGLVLTGDAAAVLEALAPLLLPLPLPALRQLRAHLDLFDARLDRVPAPDALLAALDGWSVALDAVASLATPTPQALADLARARDAASAALDAQVTGLDAWLDGFGCGTWTAELRRQLGLLPAVPAVRIDALTRDLAADIGQVRAIMAAAGDQAILDGVGRFAAQAHAFVEATLGGIPVLLDSAEERVRELLSQLPTHAFRAGLVQSVDDVIDRIDGLGIDAVPRAVEDAVAQLRSVVQGDVVGRVRAAVGGVVSDVRDAVGELERLLDDVTGALDTAVGAVTPVLARVRAAVSGFTGEIDAVVRLRGEIDLPGAAQRGVDAVTELADAVQGLLGGGVVPDALRPVLEQAADALASVDLKAILTEPASQAVADLRIELPDDVTDLLADVAALLRDALPLALIAELDAPVLRVSRALADFDPVSLLSGVSHALSDAAGTVESLDPRPHVSGAEEVFQEVLARLDRLDPIRLLAPVAGVYDDLLGKLGGVDLQGVGDRMLSGFEAAGAPLQEVVTTAARRLASEAKTPPAGGTPPPAVPGDPAPPADRPAALFRPGDGIRALGAVLDRVRVALAPVDDAVLVPVFRELHALTVGLAVRAVPEDLHGRLVTAFDRALAPARLEASLPPAVRLRAAWDRASARHGLDVALSPAVLFDARTTAARALRARVDDCTGDLVAIGGQLSAFCSGVLAAIPGALAEEVTGRGPIDAFLTQLDPEPVAAALDALAQEAAERLLAVGDALAQALESLRADIEARLVTLGPSAIMERLARLLLLFRQELDRMHPAEIGRDLRPLFLAVRGRIEAWSPVALAGRVAEALVVVADALRALDPVVLLGDLSDLDGLAERVAGLAPGRRLRPLADQLGELGEQLAGLDIEASVTVITDAAAEILTELSAAVDVVLDKLADLLRSLGSSADVSVTIDVGVSVR
ncbi:hypothetical protein [Frankia sp. QA3]|uniref:hypothetical protein n=1 Tax=Frankia sp. QA3 TaxID=710111 RepID=UPI000269BEFF|nr:hypothetical protein [Frankia sp. QA3]EIV92715.1 hypothetical protein FraQA3DRAFT_2325 [Frankia sp. QA3]